MSKIKLTGGFSLMAEGVQTLKCTKCEYNEDFGKMSLTFENAKGQKHFENFNFLTVSGEENTGAANAFSSLAIALMGYDSDAEEVDSDDLVGKFVKTTICHETYTTKDGTTKTKTSKLKGAFWENATGFEDTATTDKFDLDELLAF